VRNLRRLEPGSGFGIDRRLALGLVFAVAFFLRLIHVFSYSTVPTSDGYYYVDMAVNRLSLEHLFKPTGFCLFPPGYPVFLKPFFLLLTEKGALVAIQVAQAALGAWTCMLMYHLARRMHSRRAGIAAAFLTCLFGHFLFYSSVFMSESLFIPVYFAALVFMMRCAERPAPRSLYLSGIAFMASLFVRPAAISLAPVALVAVWRAGGDWRGRLRAALLLAAGGLTLLAPWAIRNRIAYGDLVLLAPNGVLNLYIGNHAGATGRYVVPPEDWDDDWVDSAYYAREVAVFVTNDPFGAAANILRLKWETIWEFVAPWPLGSSNPQLFPGEHYFLVLSWRSVLILGLVGLGALIVQGRSRAWLPAASLAVYTVFYLAYFGHSRFRLPAEGFFLAWGGVALACVAKAFPWTRRARAPAWGGVAALALLLVLAQGAVDAVATRADLSRSEGILAERGRFQVAGLEPPYSLFGEEPIRIGRGNGRYLRMSLDAFRQGGRVEPPRDIGQIRLAFYDRDGWELDWKESAAFHLETLPLNDRIPISFKVQIPPRAAYCHVTLHPTLRLLDQVIFSEAVLRYSRGNDLAGEFLFPHMRRAE
jgi:4-amino-4-deoxy-L-arabinose transferase-like glycosyltransferase